MESVLHKQIVLRLNSGWQPIGFSTVRDAITAMTGQAQAGGSPALALDVGVEDGEVSYVNPVKWEDWLLLPVRDEDLAVMTSKGAIRCPLVLVMANYSKVPFKTPRLSPSSIFERDGGICQYSGRKLSKKQASMDHVVPKSKGGKDSWENLVLADKQLNQDKGNKFNHEIGLTLLRQPKAPPSLPISATLGDPRHPHHNPFMIKK